MVLCPPVAGKFRSAETGCFTCTATNIGGKLDHAFCILGRTHVHMRSLLNDTTIAGAGPIFPWVLESPAWRGKEEGASFGLSEAQSFPVGRFLAKDRSVHGEATGPAEQKQNRNAKIDTRQLVRSPGA